MKFKGMRISIANYAYERIRAFVDKAKGEIGGMLAIERVSNGHLHVHRADLLPQEVSAGSVELDEVAVHAWLRREKLLSDKPIPYSTFGFWHSHAGFGAFWSSTDEATLVKTWLTRGWLVNLVMNKKGEYRLRVDTLVGGATIKDAQQVTLDEIPMIVEPANYPKMQETINAEFKEHVKEAVVVVTRATAVPVVTGRMQSSLAMSDAQLNKLAYAVLKRLGRHPMSEPLPYAQYQSMDKHMFLWGKETLNFWATAGKLERAWPHGVGTYWLARTILAHLNKNDRTAYDCSKLAVAVPKVLTELIAKNAQKPLLLPQVETNTHQYPPSGLSKAVLAGACAPFSHAKETKLTVLAGENIDPSWKGRTMERHKTFIVVRGANGRNLFSALASASFRAQVLDATGLDILDLKDSHENDVQSIVSLSDATGTVVN